MTAVLSSGNQDLAVESQRVFRSLLQAMAEPGTVATLGSAFQHPAQLGQAQTAVALTLLDHETAVWLSPRLRVPAVQSFLRFHTGAPFVDDPRSASFVLADSMVNLPALAAFHICRDALPEQRSEER